MRDLKRFIRRYGWRAWMVFALTIITCVVLVQTAFGSSGSTPSIATSKTSPTSSGSAGSAVQTAAATGRVKVDQPSGSETAVLSSEVLPPGANYTEQGAGTYTVLPGQSTVVGSGPLRRYTVEYENGITGVDLNAFATIVDSTLANPKSWAGSGFSLQRVASGAVDFRITLVSSLTVRSICGYEEQIETSCFTPENGNRVVLNNARWVRGAVAYTSDIDTYRLYMVNHEVGHALGNAHQFDCLANGLAPVMMQQTKSVQAQNGALCRPNPWPNP